jgi:hypothetical protein
VARSFTRAEIRARALFHAELDTATNFAPTSNVSDLINAHVAMVWSEIVDAGPPDWASSTEAYAASSAATQALPASFLQETLVLVTDGSQKRPLVPAEDFDRGRLQAPTQSYTLTLEYVPTAPTWTGADGAGQTFDGIAGFEELICLRVAIDLLDRGKRDSSALVRKAVAEEARIAKRGRRKRGGPRYLRDVETAQRLGTSSVPLVAYRVCGANIELYESLVTP